MRKPTEIVRRYPRRMITASQDLRAERVQVAYDAYAEIPRWNLFVTGEAVVAIDAATALSMIEVLSIWLFKHGREEYTDE